MKVMTAEQRNKLDTDLSTLRAFLTPERWTRGVLAVDEYGRVCGALSPDAVRWCVWGAEQKLFPPSNSYMRLFTLDNLIVNRAFFAYGINPIGVNDELGYDAVIALLHPVTEEEAAC